jgi:hypothetical protein
VREAEDVREGRRSRRYGWFAQTDLLESHIRGLAACTPPWRSRTRTVPMRWRPLRFLAVRHSALGGGQRAVPEHAARHGRGLLDTGCRAPCPSLAAQRLRVRGRGDVWQF